MLKYVQHILLITYMFQSPLRPWSLCTTSILIKYTVTRMWLIIYAEAYFTSEHLFVHYITVNKGISLCWWCFNLIPIWHFIQRIIHNFIEHFCVQFRQWKVMVTVLYELFKLQITRCSGCFKRGAKTFNGTAW
jgi:hypothetical protein